MANRKDLQKMAIAAATISTAIFALTKFGEDNEIKKLSVNRDENTKAYLLGDGFGNLALAYSLINHANLNPENIIIYTKEMNEFLNIKDEKSDVIYANFENRFSKFNFKNTLEILENIFNHEELEGIIKMMDTKENPLILDIMGYTSYDRDSVDESTKKTLYKLLLSPMDINGKTIEKYFLFTDFLDSNLFFYLSSIYSLKPQSPVKLLREALINYIGSKNYFTLDADRLHLKLKNYLTRSGVNFKDGYEFIDFSKNENYIDKLVFEKGEQIEEVLVNSKDIISIESPSFMDKLSLGTLTEISTNILNAEDFYNKKKDVLEDLYKKIESENLDRSVLYAYFDFKDDSFVEKVREKYEDRDFFVFKIKSGVSVKFIKNNVILKVVNPDKNSIFVGDSFRALNGEDFFFELIKLFNLENDYGDLRFSLKTVGITILENYLNRDGENYKTNLYNLENLSFISSKNNEKEDLYSVEKLITQGINNAHSFMGIDHIEVYEKDLSKLEILKYLNTL
ncbi:oleate hydratase [Peptoniphilus sp. MSJ-1]|uniref:Oleate hydratase n=1 Tax=Peptoniphilus ovalis TaxID=2841503 RepID=A0ABS6FHS6_9FIRM|nr:oleate hydratase [Peptoniphilus ovalis]MBU5668790.1 oleate hydratase [Peptoniphilus ovalis]